MRIAIVSEWFSEGMGYAENILPRVFSRMGHQVDVFTSDLQVYGGTPLYAETYEEFLGPATLPIGRKSIDDYVLHRLPRRSKRKRELAGLEHFLEADSYDLIYGFEVNQPLSKQLLSFQRNSATRLFLESRLHRSVFQKQEGPARLAQKVRNRALGYVVSKRADALFPVAEDVLDILCSEFRISERKLFLQGLGVDDTCFFDAPGDAEASDFREILGVGKSDVLFVYTGRFTKEKGVDLLLGAFNALRRSGRRDTHLLLAGGGELKVAVDDSPGVTVLGFQQQADLAKIYRAADVGVWPRQESTSRFDAAACGAGLIVPRFVGDEQRLPQGTVFFDPNSVTDLQRAMGEQLPRSQNGETFGGFRLPIEFSWTSIASQILSKC